MRRRGFLGALAAAILTVETFVGAAKVERDRRRVRRYISDGEIHELMTADAYRNLYADVLDRAFYQAYGEL